jgi:FkbM family methyltransferase
MSGKHALRKLLWKGGYDICKFTPAAHPIARRKQLLKLYEIDTVLDIGANSGQFALQLRNDIGYSLRILSFEPLSSAFELLKTKAKNDPAWEVFHFALGENAEMRKINIAGNSLSSSFLEMLPAHVQVAPDSRYVGQEEVEIKTLDVLFGDLCRQARNIYMKIDTQGFESQVLKGAVKSLAQIHTVQMEMSLVPMYAGGLAFNEMCSFMSMKGYTLIAIDHGFSDPASGQLLQVDGIFHRLESQAS